MPATYSQRGCDGILGGSLYKSISVHEIFTDLYPYWLYMQSLCSSSIVISLFPEISLTVTNPVAPKKGKGLCGTLLQSILMPVLFKSE